MSPSRFLALVGAMFVALAIVLAGTSMHGDLAAGAPAAAAHAGHAGTHGTHGTHGHEDGNGNGVGEREGGSHQGCLVCPVLCIGAAGAALVGAFGLVLPRRSGRLRARANSVRGLLWAASLERPPRLHACPV